MKFCTVAPPHLSIPFEKRVEHAQHPVAKQLLQLMPEKKSNLTIAADLSDRASLLDLARKVGPHICVLKTHIDILDDFDWAVVEELQALALEHNFLLFEDRKFADIGNTVKMQYGGGIYRIADWAHITNAHILPGPGIIEGLREVGLNRDRGLLLLAELSSKGSWATGAYSDAAIMLAKQYPDFVMGFVTQTCLSDNQGMLHFTPGIKLEVSGDKLGQQYRTPKRVIGELGSDIAIVGRGILTADDPIGMTEKYREACWKAYEDRLES